MKAYKGFDKDFKCRGKQYEEGKTFTEDKARLCECGIHFCKYPLDCLTYYNPNHSKYAEVEVDDDKIIEENDGDTKCVTTKLTVKSELNFIDLAKASIEYIKEKIDNIKKPNYISSEKDTAHRSASTSTSEYSISSNTRDCSVAANTGEYSASTNIGDYSASTSTMDCSVATNAGQHSASVITGDRSVATNTGKRSIAANTGNCSATENTGHNSVATSTGNWSAAESTGYSSIAANTGDYSASINMGDYSASINTGELSVAITKGKNTAAFAFGPNTIAKGGDIDNWIVLSEWGLKRIEEDENCVCIYYLKDIKSFKVDGIDILPDTFYKLVNGQPVVVEEDELKHYNY